MVVGLNTGLPSHQSKKINGDRLIINGDRLIMNLKLYFLIVSDNSSTKDLIIKISLGYIVMAG